MNNDIKKYFADMAVEERLAEMHNDCVNNHAGDGEARGDWSIEIETLQLAMYEIERLNQFLAACVKQGGEQVAEIEKSDASNNKLLEENLTLREELDRMKADRRVLQERGEHDAPCARFCESNAYEIAERHYKAEIERLNVQVAMLRHNIAWVSGLVENWSGEENGHHDRIMSQSSDEWLADHDAKVRDDAIEEMAVEIESFRSDYDKYSVAEAVISMKGKS